MSTCMLLRGKKVAFSTFDEPHNGLLTVRIHAPQWINTNIIWTLWTSFFLPQHQALMSTHVQEIFNSNRMISTFMLPRGWTMLNFPSFHTAECPEQGTVQLYFHYSTEFHPDVQLKAVQRSICLCFINNTRPEQQYKINMLHLISK